MKKTHWLMATAAATLVVAGLTLTSRTPETVAADAPTNLDWMVADASLKTPFASEVPITFVTRNQNQKLWDSLPQFWNAGTETVADPLTGKQVTRKIVQIKLPLGLTQAPSIPAENAMTLDKFVLGKKLYFDPILSSDNTVSCASCHDPEKGYSDQSTTSTGIFGKKGGMNAPTVLVSAYNRFQFWDGRAASLEEQSQGPPQNPVEMFDGKSANAWHAAVLRIRSKPEYVAAFQKVFGTLPTRDTVAKAIAAYERTVLAANSLVDRAEVAMRARVEDEESTDYTLKAEDVATVIKEAIAKKDSNALSAIDFDPNTDMDKINDLAKSISNGKALFFGKARCSSCHVGDTFTDHDFHNLGVGVKDGQLPDSQVGRIGSQPTGHKNFAAMGAFKTPTVRGLLGTAPYLHDGSERTLEAVVDFYDRGGNANEFLDPKMRDVDAEAAYIKAKAEGTTYSGPEVVLCGPNKTPIVPRKLNLTASEKKDLVLYMKGLQGDPVDPIVANPEVMPK
ncbi:cytochrome-c peroxidase [Tuwongella immobilis]|uniref:Cytochrome c domain-containing protein n=1 Tax=Tuwongella immobilis TaxID=692036 RepID=A0A6C2YW94_9BACT|nr:cytochrome c peroxidase [Tuwongella immobilis]VIP05637.1 cytochrome c peroxidase : Cytochrome-c peroxidase OS=Planctomyces maris DSM 8797 GN=PM8797T_11701 PE=4 SV=1: CCP_MauG [Tuwongella immobilis]VTS08630.1 cytochrome c peroxidase : Cytochrome-c peroxidase OS=Planctomyces maris DSM 8797 GN=PM8797T_11701 PE=4 SV=1: CCP_MauG [Tuwongella immobilis]